MRILLSRAALCFRQNIWLILLFVAVELLVPIFVDLNVGPKLILYIFALFLFHRTILTGPPGGAATRKDPRLPDGDWPEMPGWRLWLVIVLLFLTDIGAIVLFTSLLKSFAQAQNLGRNELIGLTILLTLVVQWLLLSLFGTAIPAATLNYRTSPGEVLTRARHSFFFIASRLLIGPGLLGSLMFAGLLYAATAGLLPGWQSLADITPVSALIELGFGFMRYFIMCLTAAILSEGYLRALEPASQDSATP